MYLVIISINNFEDKLQNAYLYKFCPLESSWFINANIWLYFSKSGYTKFADRCHHQGHKLVKLTKEAEESIYACFVQKREEGGEKGEGREDFCLSLCHSSVH